MDAGTLGAELFCQAALVGAANGTFACATTAVFSRGTPSATTLTVRTTPLNGEPEVNFTVRVPAELEAGKTYGWADDVLSADLLVLEPATGNTFQASKREMVEPATFALRVGATTGRVATATGAQLRVLFQLEATLRPTATSPAPNSTRVTVAVTR